MTKKQIAALEDQITHQEHRINALQAIITSMTECLKSEARANDIIAETPWVQTPEFSGLHFIVTSNAKHLRTMAAQYADMAGGKRMAETTEASI